MPLSDELGDEVRTVLPAGEALLAVISVEPAFGSTGAEDPDFRQSKAGIRLAGRVRGVTDALDRASDRAGMPRWLAKGAVVAGGIGGVGPSWSGPGRLLRRWLGGTVVAGGPGSAARTLQAELSPHGFGRYLAVTDRRLVLLAAAPILSGRSVAEDQPEWSLPCEAVAHARRRPRLVARARFELVFTDGSRILLSGYPPHLGGSPARRIVAALPG